MKIIIASGGTGGHLYPAVRVAEALSKEGHSVVFIGAFSSSKEYLEGKGYPLINLDLKGLNYRNIKEAIIACFLTARAFFISLGLIRNIKPEVVAGFGGYGSFAVVLAAKALGKRVLIHEQNVKPGRANRILSFMADKIAMSFSDTFKYVPKKNAILTGCPIHAYRTGLKRAELLRKYNLAEGIPVMLVFGGSQGSNSVNKAFTRACELLKGNRPFQVVHICGNNGFEDLNDFYKGLGIRYSLFKFVDNMGEAFEIADLAVARSGALSVTEIAFFRIPAIFIPYPYAGNHQLANAMVLSEKGLAFVLEENRMTPEILKDTLLKLLEQSNSAKVRFSAVESFYRPEAALDIAREIISLAE
ncbi:MAG: undecaprenyldiphospho-muramoylpentapeptide beta-N-acetylglucosaminyltransferase [Candidatus Omnitrophica bacterium]|nr:undecaprenyldiphospho-muramoylpentapeptide beta-N-acetylglucosaminyltransferase [Candidatus Omnitrophota bacterium]